MDLNDVVNEYMSHEETNVTREGLNTFIIIIINQGKNRGNYSVDKNLFKIVK